jgi:hypothetical protein
MCQHCARERGDGPNEANKRAANHPVPSSNDAEMYTRAAPCRVAPEGVCAAVPLSPPAVQTVVDAIDAADATGDLDRFNEAEAHAWLDGPVQPRGRH